MLEDNGGAKKVVAGGAGFAACLTHSGRVVVWGDLHGRSGMDGLVRRSSDVCPLEVRSVLCEMPVCPSL